VREQNLDWVVEQLMNGQGVGHGCGGEVVFEDNGQVEFAAVELGVGGGWVDEVVADHKVGVLVGDQGGNLGGQIDQCAEERPESDGSVVFGGQSLHLQLAPADPGLPSRGRRAADQPAWAEHLRGSGPAAVSRVAVRVKRSAATGPAG
jgi:hypothetical protein